MNLVDPVENVRLRSVEVLVTPTVFVGKLDHKFEVRAMKAGVTVDLASPPAEDVLQERCIRK